MVERRKPLRVNPDTQRAWQDRSRARAIERARTTTRTPLRTKSTRQRRIDRYRTDVCRPAVVARDGERCFARALVPEVPCGTRYGRHGLELHEIRARSLWRGGAVVPANQRLLCPAHHDWTETVDGIRRGPELLATTQEER